MFNNLS
ncbi:hypothetical protein CISIN_1g0473622mg, partial [Citrus sinensis]